MVAKALLLLYGLLPFQWALFSGSGHDIAIVRVWVLFIILIWVASSLYYKKVVLLSPWPLFFFMGTLAISGSAFFWAFHPEATLAKWVFWLNFFPLLLVLYEQLQREGIRVKVLKALVIGGTASAVLGCIQFVSQFFLGIERAYALWIKPLPFFLGENFAASVLEYPSFLVNVEGATLLRASAFFPDPHIYAYFLGMTLPVALWLSFRERKTAWYFSSGILCVTLLLTFSRSAYVALLCTASLTLLFWLRQYASLFSLRRVLLLGIVFVLLIFSPINTRFFSSFSLEDGSVTERLRLMHEAREHIGERPWFGVGLGNYPFFVKPTAGEREPIYVHNLYLDILVEMGLGGAFFLIGLLFLGLFAPPSPLPGATPAFFALIFFFSQSLFENPLFSVHIVPLLLLFLALRLQYRYA